MRLFVGTSTDQPILSDTGGLMKTNMIRRRRLMWALSASTLAALMALVTAAPQAAAAASDPDVTGRSVSLAAESQTGDIGTEPYGKCLAVGGGSKANGARVIQWPCNGHAEQIWTRVVLWRYNGIASVRIVNKNSGKCLAVAGGSDAEAAKVIQWDCVGSQDQRWIEWPEPNSRRWVSFQNGNSIKCLAVAGASTANGAGLIQYTCGHTGQRFVVDATLSD
jgi:hypothetical protein